MSEYRLNDPQKGIIGPVRLGTVRDLMDAGVIHSAVLVSKDGGPFLPIDQFPEMPVPTAAGDAPVQPTYAGDIGKNTFFKVFYRLHLSRANGLLVLEDGPRRKDVYLIDGVPVMVFSNVIYEKLGEFLALHGLLKRRHLAGALKAVSDDDVRLGDVLVSNGVLTQPQLATALRNQAVFRLVDLCLWETGRYLFFEGQKPTDARVDLKLSVPDLIVQAAREMPERALLRRLSAHYLSPVLPTPRFGSQVAQLRFSDAEKAIIKSFDGRLCIADIAGHYGDDPALRHAALVAMYLLWEVDAIAYEGSAGQ